MGLIKSGVLYARIWHTNSLLTKKCTNLRKSSFQVNSDMLHVYDGPKDQAGFLIMMPRIHGFHSTSLDIHTLHGDMDSLNISSTGNSLILAFMGVDGVNSDCSMLVGGCCSVVKFLATIHPSN